MHSYPSLSLARDVLPHPECLRAARGPPSVAVPSPQATLPAAAEAGSSRRNSEFQLKEGNLHRAARRLFQEEQLLSPPSLPRRRDPGGVGLGFAEGVAWFKVVTGGQGQ